MNKRSSKIIIQIFTCVIVGVLVLSPVAQAQVSAGTKVPVADDGVQRALVGSSSGLLDSIGLGRAVEVFNQGLKQASDLTCKAKKVTDILETVEDINKWSFGGLKFISGDAGESNMILSKIGTLTTHLRTCLEPSITSTKALNPPSIKQMQEKQTVLDLLSKEKASVEQRLEQLNHQYRLATQNFWKSVTISILLKTTKVVSQRLVNTITSKYKINDVLKYADAIASNVYTAQLIQDRAVDGQEQLILRSIITNPLLRSKVDSAIYQRAADALELNGSTFTASSISADDPDFYLKLGKFGDPQTNPAFMKTVYENRASEINSVSLSSAQNEILLGSGLKAPRNCSGNVNEQKAIDQKWAQTSDQLKNRLDLLNDLKNAYSTRSQFTNDRETQRLQDDLKKAEADYVKASQQLKAMPTSYKSPVLKICEAIASPAELVNKGVDKAFGAFTNSMSDYNDNNLPFFMSWISDIGANIANNLIFGGDLKASLLSESSNLAQAVNYGLSFVDAQSARKNLENGINFGYEPGNGKDEYILSWEMVNVDRADYVTINGDGISDVKRDSAGRVITETTRIGNATVTVAAVNKLAKDGSVAIKTSRGGEYSLKVYDKNNVLLTNRASITITPQSTQASASTGTNGTGGGSSGGTGGSASGGSGVVCGGNYASLTACMADTGDQAYCNNLCGQVRGASINLSEHPRGDRTESLR